MTDDNLRDLLDSGVPEPRRTLLADDVLATASRQRVQRRLTTLGTALLVVVAVASTALFVNGRNPDQAATPPDCPMTYGSSDRREWVPNDPTADGASNRLVPDTAPTQALLCKYEPVRAELSSLVGRKELVTGLELIPDDLNLARSIGEQRACTLIGSVPVPYLLRLSYPSGTVWVSTIQEANGCQNTVNGDFTSTVYTGDQMQQAFTDGAWALSKLPFDTSCYTRGGRAGQERDLLPPGAVSINVCHSDKDGTRLVRTITDSDTIRAIGAILNDPSAEPTSAGCSGTTHDMRTLVATYAVGREVHVNVLPGCQPTNTMNSSLSTTLSEDDVAELEALLGD